MESDLIIAQKVSRGYAIFLSSTRKGEISKGK
jgi:hypothetical protein